MKQSVKLIAGNWKMNGLGASLAEAKALRAGFALERAGSRLGSDADAGLRSLVDQLSFRFGDADGAFTVAGKDIALDGLFWSPVVGSETMTVEVSGPLAAVRGLRLRPVQLSHFDIDPAAPDMLQAVTAKIGESDSCQIDSRCVTNAPSGYRTAVDAVARMVFTQGGSSYLCTGTLLNNSNSPRRHLFWSANHCISTQTVANTLQTYWFYEAASCGGTTVATRARTLTGGATLRHNNNSRDTLLLELKAAPPTGAPETLLPQSINQSINHSTKQQPYTSPAPVTTRPGPLLSGTQPT